MKYKEIPEMRFYVNEEMNTGTSTTYIPCKHGSGWFCYPIFWIFKCKYFCCRDCGKLIKQGKWYLR